MFYLDGAAPFVRIFTARRRTDFLLDAARNRLSRRFNRAASGGVLQFCRRCSVAVFFNWQRSDMRGDYVRNALFSPETASLQYSLDARLDGDDYRQYVALRLFHKFISIPLINAKC